MLVEITERAMAHTGPLLPPHPDVTPLLLKGQPLC
jgi:hypothetical protein